jgi:hypothetical protein
LWFESPYIALALEKLQIAILVRSETDNWIKRQLQSPDNASTHPLQPSGLRAPKSLVTTTKKVVREGSLCRACLRPYALSVLTRMAWSYGNSTRNSALYTREQVLSKQDELFGWDGSPL